jgi:hypothetical protein
MSIVRIHLLENSVRRRLELFFITNGAIPQIKTAIAENGYLVLPPMQLKETGEDAADEIFDLTNNPGRDEERQLRYGNGQSLSSGDIVEVDGQKYLCMSMGWKVIE